jgi:hypothetical protein
VLGHEICVGLKTKVKAMADIGNFETVDDRMIRVVAERAVLAERERCAKIAESYDVPGQEGLRIADEIRSGK